jgi:hypothetical protein
MKRIAILMFTVLAACAPDDDLALLDHAQILAVRATPAHAAPGERVKIDMLAGDDAGTVFEATPETLTAGPLPVEHAADGWYVTAPEMQMGAHVDVSLTIDGTAWRASKQLVFGMHADNPAVATMQVDGAPTAMIDAQVGDKRTLDVQGTGAEPLSYAWYTSVGTLAHYRSATTTLDASEAGQGTVLVVIRDAAGGVTWRELPLSVR